jgi:hypothetical protein
MQAQNNCIFLNFDETQKLNLMLQNRDIFLTIRKFFYKITYSPHLQKKAAPFEAAQM